MPGIIVGIDGSDRSHQALEWAVNEAAVWHAPLTVLTHHAHCPVVVIPADDV